MKKLIFPKDIDIYAVLPTFFIAMVFLGDTQTTLKAVIVAGAVMLFNSNRLGKIVDGNLLLIVIFTFFYFLISKVDGFQKTDFAYPLLILPAVLYAAGKWLGLKAASTMCLVLSLLLFGSMLGSLSIMGLTQNISNYGFEGGARNIALAGEGIERSATVIAGTLIVLIALGGVALCRMNVVSRVFIGLAFALGMFLALRLGSRTLLSLGVLSVLCGILINVRRQGAVRLGLVIAVFAVAVSATYARVSQDIEILSYLQDRMNSDEYGFGSAGGRLERWISSVNLILEHPFGWSIEVNGYSHNFWLDAARNGGWISLMLSAAIFLAYSKSFRRAIANNEDDLLFVTTSVCMSVCLLGLFFVEPILDGFMYVFGFSCCFWGVLSERAGRRCGSASIGQASSLKGALS